METTEQQLEKLISLAYRIATDTATTFESRAIQVKAMNAYTQLVATQLALRMSKDLEVKEFSFEEGPLAYDVKEDI